MRQGALVNGDVEGEDLQVYQKNMASTFFWDITIKCTLIVTTHLISFAIVKKSCSKVM